MEGNVVLVTGGAGLLGRQHCIAIASAGGIPVLIDNDGDSISDAKKQIRGAGFEAISLELDLLNPEAPIEVERELRALGLQANSLVNNVANNPPMFSGAEGANFHGISGFDPGEWSRSLEISLSVAANFGFYFGGKFASQGRGSIVHIASDLALIAPDHRIYLDDRYPDDRPKKPMSYVVSKTALLGLNRYLATYWSPIPVRSNALALGSVLHKQDEKLIQALENRIPLGRLAQPSEYRGALIFLLSKASEYMTGNVLTLDGGRTAW